MNDTTSTTSGTSPKELPQALRTLISLLLFVHLFALAVIVLAHTGQSELAAQVRQRVPLLQPYLRRLWMDHTYTYSDYVNPQPTVRLDAQYHLEVDYEYADGSTRRLELPGNGDWLETRLRRYLTLARSMAAVAGEDIEAEYASMLASGLLAEDRDAVSLRLACVERFTPTTSEEPPDHPNAVRGDDGAYYATVYRCRAWINDEDGSIEIKKEEASRRLSPVKRTGAKS
jgi:hypothetical protein